MGTCFQTPPKISYYQLQQHHSLQKPHTIYARDYAETNTTSSTKNCTRDGESSNLTSLKPHKPLHYEETKASSTTKSSKATLQHHDFISIMQHVDEINEASGQFILYSIPSCNPLDICHGPYVSKQQYSCNPSVKAKDNLKILTVSKVNLDDTDSIYKNTNDVNEINEWKGPATTADRKIFGSKIMTLFHVTDVKSAESIFKENRMRCGTKGMFGGGIYFAETAQDAHYKSKRSGILIYARVFVGNERIVLNSSAGYFDFATLQQLGFDSVYAPYGSGKGAAERVVYNSDQVRLIAKRIYKPLPTLFKLSEEQTYLNSRKSYISARNSKRNDGKLLIQQTQNKLPTVSNENSTNYIPQKQEEAKLIFNTCFDQAIIDMSAALGDESSLESDDSDDDQPGGVEIRMWDSESESSMELYTVRQNYIKLNNKFEVAWNWLNRKTFGSKSFVCARNETVATTVFDADHAQQGVLVGSYKKAEAMFVLSLWSAFNIMINNAKSVCAALKYSNDSRLKGISIYERGQGEHLSALKHVGFGDQDIERKLANVNSPYTTVYEEMTAFLKRHAKLCQTQISQMIGIWKQKAFVLYYHPENTLWQLSREEIFCICCYCDFDFVSSFIHIQAILSDTRIFELSDLKLTWQCLNSATNKNYRHIALKKKNITTLYQGFRGIVGIDDGCNASFFMGPQSASSNPIVALQFAYEPDTEHLVGCVLEYMMSKDDNTSLRFVDVSWISQFAKECEWLTFNFPTANIKQNNGISWKDLAHTQFNLNHLNIIDIETESKKRCILKKTNSTKVMQSVSEINDINAVSTRSKPSNLNNYNDNTDAIQCTKVAKILQEYCIDPKQRIAKQNNRDDDSEDEDAKLEIEPSETPKHDIETRTNDNEFESNREYSLAKIEPDAVNEEIKCQINDVCDININSDSNNVPISVIQQPDTPPPPNAPYHLTINYAQILHNNDNNDTIYSDNDSDNFNNNNNDIRRVPIDYEDTNNTGCTGIPGNNNKYRDSPPKYNNSPAQYSNNYGNKDVMHNNNAPSQYNKHGNNNYGGGHDNNKSPSSPPPPRLKIEIPRCLTESSGSQNDIDANASNYIPIFSTETHEEHSETKQATQTDNAQVANIQNEIGNQESGWKCSNCPNFESYKPPYCGACFYGYDENDYDSNNGNNIDYQPSINCIPISPMSSHTYQESENDCKFTKTTITDEKCACVSKANVSSLYLTDVPISPVTMSGGGNENTKSGSSHNNTKSDQNDGRKKNSQGSDSNKQPDNSSSGSGGNGNGGDESGRDDHNDDEKEEKKKDNDSDSDDDDDDDEQEVKDEEKKQEDNQLNDDEYSSVNLNPNAPAFKPSGKNITIKSKSNLRKNASAFAPKLQDIIEEDNNSASNDVWKNGEESVPNISSENTNESKHDILPLIKLTVNRPQYSQPCQLILLNKKQFFKQVMQDKYLLDCFGDGKAIKHYLYISLAIQIDCNIEKIKTFKCNGNQFIILNFDLKHRGYAVGQLTNPHKNECIMVSTHSKNYLFTAEEIRQQFNKPILPQSPRQSPKFKAALNAEHLVRNELSKLMKNRKRLCAIKWETEKQNVRIYGSTGNPNKENTMLSLQKSCFADKLIKSARKCNYNFELIRIIIDEKYGYGIHFVWIVNIDTDVGDTDIAISWKYTANNGNMMKLRATGIHLDKRLLKPQHQAIDAYYECDKCLNAYKPSINNLRIFGSKDTWSKDRQECIQFKKQKKNYLSFISGLTNVVQMLIQYYEKKTSEGNELLSRITKQTVSVQTLMNTDQYWEGEVEELLELSKEIESVV